MADGVVPPFQTGVTHVAKEAVELTHGLRSFLDRVAALGPGSGLTQRLIDDLNDWSARLEGKATAEEYSLWRKGQRNQPPALLPELSFAEDGTRLDGNVMFGRFHVGRGAVHGGAIGLVFDELMGALAGSAGRSVARTAYLHVDFRSLTPMGVKLDITASIMSESGRKRIVESTISNAGVVCAEAHGLWVEVATGDRAHEP